MAEALYTARISLPYLLEQGRNNAIRCPVYRDGTLVAPSSGTCTVYDASYTSVATPAVSITGGIATATVTSGSIAASSRGSGWRIVWALVMPDGVTHTYESEASLVRRVLYPVVTETDLYQRADGLNPASAGPLTKRQSWSDKLDEAWTEINLRLIEAGNRPDLILSPTALRSAHLALTLALIYEDLAGRLNPAYEARAQAYRAEYRDAWGRVQLVYDTDDNGQPDGEDRRSAGRAVWLSSGGR